MENRPERTICLEELRRRIARLEAPRQRAHDPPLRSGCDALDRHLPEGGFRSGTLVEWLSPGEGIGAGTLALLAAKVACQDGRVLAVLDPRREFCPTAVVTAALLLAEGRLQRQGQVIHVLTTKLEDPSPWLRQLGPQSRDFCWAFWTVRRCLRGSSRVPRRSARGGCRSCSRRGNSGRPQESDLA